MEVHVHNLKEATALVKEWNQNGTHAGVPEISFFKHETEEYLGRVYWWKDRHCFIWE